MRLANETGPSIFIWTNTCFHLDEVPFGDKLFAVPLSALMFDTSMPDNRGG